MRGLSSVPQPTDINLNDVIDAIRQTDPATYQSFQSNGNGQEASIMSTSYPPPMASNTLKSMDSNRSKKQAYVKITEQPASKGLRFRYECEGRSAGSIPGVSSTPENKTYPTIQVVGYKGRAVVVVSCVTSDAPYKPHPHNLVGKEGCSKGVCTIEMDSETMSCSFPSLGIQCVKKKEIEESLNLRQQIRVDPFQTGFGHKDHPQGIDLNCIRLCYQVFLEGSDKGAFTFALKPVVSDPIFDKKARNDLTICRMTDCSASVAGGKEILLFCEKVTKDDIEVRFFQEDNHGKVIWEGFGDFQPSDVHKQYGICFRTPRYHNLEEDQNVPVKLQLRRPSDGAVSDSKPFEFTPINGGQRFWASKRIKTNYSLFNNILTSDMSVQSDTLRRKIPGNSPAASLASPDSTMHHVVVQPPTSIGQMTQPIQLVHASAFPPPPSPIKGIATTVTCQTPDLPPPPTPLFEESKSPPPRAANMNLRPISDAPKYQDSDLIIPAVSTTMETPRQMDVAEMAQKNDVNDDVEVYDEVIPIVYDDVDTKYDGMDFSAEPPAPPIRKRLPSTVVNTIPPTPIEEPNRPLPQTPSKRPSLISKFKSDKKEKGKGSNKKANQKEDSLAGDNGNRPTSLFQRLFHRSKSVDASLAHAHPAPPQVPPHQKDDNGNDNIMLDENSGDMKVLQDFIDGGNLENLDNMVTEFVTEFDEVKNEANGNNVAPS